MIAGAVAAECRAGDLLVLLGDLGAGKTAFTQGLGAALGVREPITSPTFTLAREYEGRLRLHHLDVYRLGGSADAVDLAIEELLDDEAVVVVEWGDVIADALDVDRLEVRITYGEGDDDRVLAFTAVGRRWADRLAEMIAALAATGLAC